MRGINGNGRKERLDFFRVKLCDSFPRFGAEFADFSDANIFVAQRVEEFRASKHIACRPMDGGGHSSDGVIW